MSATRPSSPLPARTRLAATITVAVLGGAIAAGVISSPASGPLIFAESLSAGISGGILVLGTKLPFGYAVVAGMAAAVNPGTAVGAGLVLLGGAVTAGRHPGSSLGPRAAVRFRGAALAGGVGGYAAYGAAYALASLGCTLPVFLGVVATSFQLHGAATAAGQFMLFGLGMGIVLTALTAARPRAICGRRAWPRRRHPGLDGLMTDLGVVFLPQLPPERLCSVARAADEAGLDELWLWEDCFREGGIASAAAALAWTERLRVGVGLLPVPLRNAALAAMEMATLHRLFPGRVIMGVGHGVQDWMAQVGARAESPVTLLREHLTALRTLLGGGQVTMHGRYVHLDAVALDWPPAPAARVLAGASGPRSLRLSGEAADGTILTAGTPPEGVRRARELVEEGRRTAGRSGPHPLIVYVLAAAGPGAAERLEAERQRSGISPAAGISVDGDAPAVAEAIQRWADAGAGTVVLQPTADDPDPEGFIRFVAGEVRPLLR